MTSLCNAIARRLKAPIRPPNRRQLVWLAVRLLACLVIALPFVWVYGAYFQPIHKYYRGDYDNFLVQAEFYSSGGCVISLMDRTDPKLTAYMHCGDYVRAGQRLTVSWSTMSGRSEFELRGDDLYLPGGSFPRISKPLLLPTDTINQPEQGERAPQPIYF